MPCLAKVLITLLLAVPAMSTELFRYRGAAKDGGTLEYIFDAGEQNSPNAINTGKVAESRRLHDDFLPRALETQEFRTQPVPFWLVCFSGHDQGTTATNVLRRSAAGLDGCCAKGGEAALIGGR